jgi:hypothetical protein
MYVRVNEQGEVDRYADAPPQSITLADGRSVSNPDPADVDRLALGGWVEVTGEDAPTYDPDLQMLEGPTYEVTTRQYVNDEGTYPVEVPVLDAEGNPTYDEDGNPVTTTEQRPAAPGETYTVPDTVTATWNLVDREVRLEVDRMTIPADGSEFATVRYTHPGSGAPASVDFDVNGDVTTEPLVDQKAEIEVVASGPGPITVTAGGKSVTLTAPEA